MSSIGDYNKDGYQDFIVGGRGWNGWQGKVWIYFGGKDGLQNTSAAFSIMGEPNRGPNGICMGHSVVNLGDINGDGVNDFGASGPGSWGTWDVGRLYIFYGGTNPFPDRAGEDAVTIMQSPTLYDWFGESFANAGDYNGDGFTDIIVGAPGNANPTDGQAFEDGHAYLYYGSSHGFRTTPNITLSNTIKFSAFGLSVSGNGDVNNDGLSDVIVAASWKDHGYAYVYFGKNTANNNTQEPDLVLTGADNEILFGEWVRIVKDLNNDGIDDIIVKTTDSTTYDTSIKIYFGSKDLTSLAQPDLVLTHVQKSDGFGGSFENVGDINHDGYNDLAVGAPGRFGAVGSDYPGMVYIYYGGPNMDNQPDMSFVGENGGDNFGFAVSHADINGDGKSDLLMSALQFAHQGRIYIYLSNSNSGIPVIAWVGIGVVVIAIAIFIVRKRFMTKT